MERLGPVNAQRIHWCCADRDINVEQLADLVGISSKKLTSAINGELGLTFNQLKKIANFFGRGVLFFYEEGPATDEKIRTPQFRTLSSQKPELSASVKLLIERVERQRDVYISLREDFADPDIPKFSHPQIPNDVAAAARKIRQWLNVGEENSFDTYRSAIEAKGILVFRTNGYQGKWQIAKENPILGFAIYHAECPVIVVKKLDAEAPQCFTLAHELGHLLLHRGSSIDDKEDFRSETGDERAANKFAGLLLVPDEFVEKINTNALPDDVSLVESWLKPYCDRWG